jgi:hypothetical protein
MFWSLKPQTSTPIPTEENKETLTPTEGETPAPVEVKYETFAMRFQRLFPGYRLDDGMRIRAKQGTPTISLK